MRDEASHASRTSFSTSKRKKDLHRPLDTDQAKKNVLTTTPKGYSSQSSTKSRNIISHMKGYKEATKYRLLHTV